MLYPHVPILALSATCPPGTLRDLLAILRLGSPTDGRGTAVLAPSRLSITYQTISRDSPPNCEVFQPALSEEFTLQGCLEVRSFYARRERYGQVHTRKPPQ